MSNSHFSSESNDYDLKRGIEIKQIKKGAEMFTLYGMRHGIYAGGDTILARGDWERCLRAARRHFGSGIADKLSIKEAYTRFGQSLNLDHEDFARVLIIWKE